jgi:hypothetical protein
MAPLHGIKYGINLFSTSRLTELCDGDTDGQTLGVNEAVAVLFSDFLCFVEKQPLHWQCYLKSSRFTCHGN